MIVVPVLFGKQQLWGSLIHAGTSMLNPTAPCEFFYAKDGHFEDAFCRDRKNMCVLVCFLFLGKIAAEA